ncbi:homeobox-leucine zipper protein HDG2 isoform X5 [Brassica napus]|uniref:homeobox-leucine zipper protein HDG2 isoform X5 n=1 Tax=Brassica napus TaxID=3708 RepID=UPI00207A23B7|nr:homeobox-leucine zipper protein HDG2 isoform X5 [Brassica napus]
MSEDNTRKKVKGLAFNFKFKKKMFEPNMFLAAMNNEDSNNHNYNHEDNNNNNERFLRDEEFDSANTKSGSENQEGGSGNDQDNHHPNKKKRYHRHTQLQIQEMEAFFKECPHPDDKQRKQLSRELGLEPLQVKFWFQNKRTQMKNHHERHENSHLRAENEKLRGDNIRYREALANASCPNCGGPTVIGEMSFDEHQLRLENARLREENQWSVVFAGMVSRAVSLAVLSTGVAGNYNGALQVMSAEFQVPTPLVPTRETYFARYCKQQADGSWAVVDISLDSLQPNPPVRCRRRASGCLIQEMPNGYSKVTWVEHVEVDDRGGVHDLYKHMVSTGHAFGAKRWVAILDRQCERLASVMATNISPGEVGVITNQEGRRSMLKLAERMVISFCAGVSASTAHTWTTLSGTGAEDVRVMTRKSVDDPGRPPGIVLSAATSFWIPVPPKRVFDFLRDENSRNEWDILSNGGVVQEMAHIANGRDTGNCVSLLRVNSANSSQSNMLILQESCTDPTASFVIYAPVDIVAMNIVLNGGDPDYVALLPSGFAILPDGNANGGGEGGSLLTVAFQILVDSVPTAKLSLGSVATVNNLIACTVERIKAAMSCETA